MPSDQTRFSSSKIRPFLRQAIPSDLRLQISKTRKLIKSVISGNRFRLVRNATAKVHYPTQLSVSQPIFETALSANKVENLKRAAAHINAVHIAPGRRLSFWHLVPRPAKKNGFLEGRTLVNGALVGEVGGGLCQLSGLIYQLSLMAGLKIIERHAHSVDLYTDETRFAPIGTDATVVYGYKDLCVENSTTNPIYFEFNVTPDKIEGRICSPYPIKTSELVTTVDINDGQKTVTIHRNVTNGIAQLVSIDNYVMHHHG